MAIGQIAGFSVVSPSDISFDKIKNTKEVSSPSFSEYLSDALNKTNDILADSTNLTEQFAAGNIDNINDVMVASEKANISLQFTMQVRNKILDAYNEIMRITI